MPTYKSLIYRAPSGGPTVKWHKDPVDDRVKDP